MAERVWRSEQPGLLGDKRGLPEKHICWSKGRDDFLRPSGNSYSRGKASVELPGDGRLQQAGKSSPAGGAEARMRPMGPGARTSWTPGGGSAPGRQEHEKTVPGRGHERPSAVDRAGGATWDEDAKYVGRPADWTVGCGPSGAHAHAAAQMIVELPDPKWSRPAGQPGSRLEEGA